MTKRTIHLPAGYKLRNGQVVIEYNDDTVELCPRYTVGNQALLYSITDVSPRSQQHGTRPKYDLDFDPTSIAEGLPGNSDPGVRRHHGWRGTTNDQSVDAYGVVTIVSVSAGSNGRVRVVVRD